MYIALRFETKDIVFRILIRYLKKRTKSMAKAIALEQKLRKDIGRYLSSTVVIASVRMYKNGRVECELKANNFLIVKQNKIFEVMNVYSKFLSECIF